MPTAMYCTGNFREYLLGTGLSPRTVDIYMAVADKALAWAETQRVDLTRLEPSEAQALADLFPETSSRRRQLAATMKHWWEMHGRYDGPVRAIKVPRKPTMVCRAVDNDDAARLLDAAAGVWPHGGAVIAGLSLGLRRAEIASMQWERFDEAGEWYTVYGKGSKTATIPVHPFMWRHFRPYRRRAGWVFPGRTGGHVNPATVWEWVKAVGASVGMPDLRTHQLRHTALAEMNDRTGDLRAVQTFARHSSPEMTAGYTRTTNQRLREMSESLSYLREVA